MGGIFMPYMGNMGQMGYVPPNIIPNLNLWYNASASTTTVNNVNKNNFQTSVVNGTSISKWVDLQAIGGDSNVNGGTGKEPNYAIPIQNGLGAVFYTSANSENLDINPIAWMATLSGFTIYVLARPTSLPATQFPLTVTDTSTGMWWNGTNWSIGCTAGNRGTVTVTNDTTKFHIYGMIFDGSQTGNANRLKFRYDRADKTLTFTGTIPAVTGSPAYYFFGGNNRSAGTGGATAGTYMDGYIGEVMIWTRTLTPAEQSSVELYLNTKWNLGIT
jgi:hypothetical protein